MFSKETFVFISKYFSKHLLKLFSKSNFQYDLFYYDNNFIRIYYIFYVTKALSSSYNLKEKRQIDIKVFLGFLLLCYGRCFSCYELDMLQSILRKILRKEFSAICYGLGDMLGRSLGLLFVCSVREGRCCCGALSATPHID